MAIFSKSATTEFKHKFTSTHNLISEYSFGKLRISDEMAHAKMSTQFRELIEMAQRFNDPFNESFTFYLTSVFGDKITIAGALLFIDKCIEIISNNEKLTRGITENLLYYVQTESQNTFGRSKIREIMQF